MPVSTRDAIDPDVVRLVELAKAGDANAFAQLYDRYVDQVFAYVLRRVGNRHVAEDLVGDVFLRAYRRLPTFEWQGVDLGAWIVTIARNRVNDHFKSARFRLERTVDQVRDEPTQGPDDPERVALAREMARTLGQALERLKDEHREVIELRFVHHLSVAETAEVMNRSVGATKALQYRALRALAEEVKEHPGLAQIAQAGLSSVLGGLL